MKKVLSALSLALATSSVYAIDATPLFSVYVGGGAWQVELDGNMKDANETELNDLGLSDSETSVYVYAAFEHFVPFIPQVRLEAASIDVSGTGNLTQSFSFDGQNLSSLIGAGTTTSNLQFDYVDLALYYEVAVVDFGVAFRQLDASFEATGSCGLCASPDSSLTISQSFDTIIPMGYLQTRISLPFTGGFVTGSGSIGAFDGTEVSDFRAAVGYEMNFSILARLALELGYRVQTTDIDEDESWAGDIEASGPYLGLDIKF